MSKAATRQVQALTLDQQLSEAQRVLRDGYHDQLSGAVAAARNRLNSSAVAEVVADVLEQYERRCRNYRAVGGRTSSGVWLRGEQTLYLSRKLLQALKRAQQDKT